MSFPLRRSRLFNLIQVVSQNQLDVHNGQDEIVGGLH